MLRRSLLASSAGLAALACLPASATASRSTTVSVAWPVNVGPLNPHLYSPNQMFAQAMVYEPLVRYVEGGRIEPCLATAWTIEDDGRSYVFRLRENVRFTDGVAFDAAAVKANVDAVLANRPRHQWLDLINQIEGLDVLDAMTIRLRLRNPYYPTLLELALVRPLRFLSPAAIPPGGNTAAGIAAPIGTGPWKLAETVRGERDVFLRNNAYWGDAPQVERLVIKVVPDPTTRALALQSGEIDLLYGTDLLDSDAFRRLSADPRFTAAISPPLASRLLLLNSGRGPTTDPVVRWAILHAVNRPSLVRNILLDSEPVAETLFAPNFPYTDVPLEPFAFDRARATRLLDEAGWSLPAGGKVRTRQGQACSLDLAFIGTEALQKAIAETVQGDLARVGIAVRLIGEEASSFYARQKSGEFGMIFGDTWGAPYDPHAFMASMRTPSHGDWQAQRGLPMKAEIDRRISEVLVEADDTKRRAEYAWLLRTLHEQAVYLPISYLANKLVMRRTLGRMPFGPTRNEIPFERLALAG
ncbi:Ni(2(+)) ABC transporter periplasmic binding protein [Rhodovastum atsumiense]|uniref:Nickel ABC transporter, nickel/metallophore periplasmic binding protein n=1 Tax=Rhodovastum atsumiense TaxID=504468 RepID=A0A5M6J1C5_9PROT|nr:nickel ABC transporter substrate-binding protein [Rhodovastum atsumiense]KAA5614400.1 nickel ABC transporter, nickel/metallophore periplasmic binding protein [Rhodovastum atsumiense]CAH2604878.1 Ni(2(+)) ABC transporter periplasmic binding protein [Rhodovastum atsumiense]